MGGKDTIVVDEEANLQTATDAIIYSSLVFWAKMLCLFSSYCGRINL